MNREIKFRAWDIKNKRMIYEANDLVGGYLIRIDLDGYVSATYKQICFDSDEIILMAFTGLKDKNGKEIYEGDILCYKAEKMTKDGALILGTEGFHPENSVKVYFEDGIFWGEGKYRRREEVCQLISQYRKFLIFEVIGNIYENPELLKSN